MKLYHLSEENHNGELFKPRVPLSYVQSYNPEYYEDGRTKRVCFSKTITGAYRAIDFDGVYKTLYLHVPENIDDIIKRGKLVKPTTKQVFDAEYTDEMWVRCPVRMKCIAKICIGTRYSIYTDKPPVHFRYIERY